MRIITRLVSPTPELPDVLAGMGRPPGSSAPIGVVIEHLQACRRRILVAGNTEAEADAAEVTGAEHLRVTFPDTLTPAEETLQRLAEAEALAAELRDLLTDEYGRGLAADRADRLRQLLGIAPGHATGTQAPAAGPAAPNTAPAPAVPLTDEQRRDLFRSIAKVRGGWDPSTVDGARSALTYARQHGMPDLAGADVERWEGLPAGSLGG